MTSTFELGAISDADLPAVLALLERCALPTAGVRENVAGFSVAHSGGQVVASAGLELYGPCGLLRSVAVAEPRRREGIGAALVQHVVAGAASGRLVALYLLTSTARDYFERFGFEDCPRIEAPDGIRQCWEFRQGCPASASFMRRALPAAGAS